LTQTAGNNTTLVATTAFVNNAVAGLGTNIVNTNNTWTGINTFNGDVIINGNLQFANNKTLTFPNRTANATAGQLGYQVVGTFNGTNTTPTVTDTLRNVGNLILPNGVWYIQVGMAFLPSASSVKLYLALGTTSANSETLTTTSNYSYIIQTAIPQQNNSQNVINVTCVIVNTTVSDMTIYMNAGYAFTSTSGSINNTDTVTRKLIATLIG